MALFLQIIGGVVLTVFLMAVGIFVNYKIKSYFRSKSYNTYVRNPTSIHLNEDLSPDWLSVDTAKQYLEDFKTYGFYHGKAYIVHEMHGVLLQTLFFGNFAAIVYKHPVIGLWAEVLFQSQEGNFIIASNASIGLDITSHPNNTRIYKSSAGPIELYNLVRQQTQHMYAIKLTDENFRDIYETLYKVDMSWRNNRGGVTIQEFKRYLKNANSSLKLTKEDLRRVFLEMKVDELHEWHEECIQEFKQRYDAESGNFNDIEDELFIVPNRTISQAFIEYLANYNVVQENVKDKLIEALRKQTNIQHIFDMINNSYSSELRCLFD